MLYPRGHSQEYDRRPIFLLNEFVSHNVPFFRKIFFNKGIMTFRFLLFCKNAFSRLDGPTRFKINPGTAILMCQRQQYFSDLIENHSTTVRNLVILFPILFPGQCSVATSLCNRGIAFLCTHFSWDIKNKLQPQMAKDLLSVSFPLALSLSRGFLVIGSIGILFGQIPSDKLLCSFHYSISEQVPG